MLADMLTSDEEFTFCPSPALVSLALLFAETGDLQNSIYWLKRASATRENCKDAAGIFFRDGLFDEGLHLLDQFSVSLPQITSNERSLKEYQIIADKKDFIELLSYGLQNRKMVNNQEYQSALLGFREDYQKN